MTINDYNTWSQIKALGYKINIEQIGNSKHVTFIGKFSKEGYTLSSSWSSNFSDDEIRCECIGRLMTWAGLTIRNVVTFK